MQKGMVYYFVIITMLSILLKEMYKELRKVYLYPKGLMKTLIYKPFVRGLYIFVCSLFILGGTIYINYLPRILTADFKEIHGKIYEKEIIAQNGYILCDMTFESGENIVAYMDKENVNDIEGKKVEICDVDFDYIGNFVKKIDGKYTDFYLKYYKHNILNKIMLCIYLIANYLIQTWKVNGIEEKKKRLSMELGVYSILLLWLGISGKGNAVINTIVTMLFILYNLENMFYIMPSKIEMMQAKTAEDGKIIKTQELKPLKKMDAEEYKKEYLKKIRKSNSSYLLIYTGIVYVVVLLILIIVPKERFIAGMLFYILCYFIGLFALMFNNKHKMKKIKEKNFENVNYGEGRIINSKEIEYLDNQGENKIINYPDGMNKKKTAGDNVNIIVADGRIMEIK
mgnify:FL=1